MEHLLSSLKIIMSMIILSKAFLIDFIVLFLT
jgi:hypothetical protein